MSAEIAVIGPIVGIKGADIVPPSLEQASEFARQSKADTSGIPRGLAEFLRVVRVARG
jgi:hypothetical protein